MSFGSAPGEDKTPAGPGRARPPALREMFLDDVGDCRRVVRRDARDDAAAQVDLDARLLRRPRTVEVVPVREVARPPDPPLPPREAERVRPHRADRPVRDPPRAPEVVPPDGDPLVVAGDPPVVVERLALGHRTSDLGRCAPPRRGAARHPIHRCRAGPSPRGRPGSGSTRAGYPSVRSAIPSKDVEATAWNRTGMRPASRASRPASTARRMAAAMAAGSSARLTAEATSTPSQPSSIARAASEAVPTPASRTTGTVTA